MIKLLRREFGPRFTGGFVPDEFARRAYPGFFPTLRPIGAGTSRSCTVQRWASAPWGFTAQILGSSLNTWRPVAPSFPSRCTFLFRKTLGDVLLVAKSPDEGVNACAELFSNADELSERQRSSRDYWDRYVRPDALLRNRLLEEFDGDALSVDAVLFVMCLRSLHVSECMSLVS